MPDSPINCLARFGCWMARWSPIRAVLASLWRRWMVPRRRERFHECHGRTIGAERRAAGGECRAARPTAARRAVRAWDRDRNGCDRGGPRLVLLLTGRADSGDQPARHEPADRRGWAEP